MMKEEEIVLEIVMKRKRRRAEEEANRIDYAFALYPAVFQVFAVLLWTVIVVVCTLNLDLFVLDSILYQLSKILPILSGSRYLFFVKKIVTQCSSSSFLKLVVIILMLECRLICLVSSDCL